VGQIQGEFELFKYIELTTSKSIFRNLIPGNSNIYLNFYIIDNKQLTRSIKLPQDNYVNDISLDE
jgi:hypothetical protein